MIHDNSLRVGGLITFWTVGEFSDLQILQEGFQALGLAKHAPEPRTPGAALRDALGELFSGRDNLVQPLAKKDGFEVVRVKRGETKNEYTTDLTARIKDDRILLDPYDSRAADITDVYNRHLGKIRGAMLTRNLVDIMQAEFAGTRLRPTGGIYWLADSHEPRWKEVADVVEKAAIGRPNTVYQIRHKMDEDAIKAVHDAIFYEILGEAKQLHEDLHNPDLGEKALQTRRRLAQGLRAKIQQYEEILGMGLTKLTRAVDQAEQAEAWSTMLISASAGELQGAAV